MRRKQVLLSLGLLALVSGLAGCSAERQEEPDFSAPDIAGSDLVLAEINGKPITAGEVYHKIRLQFPQMPHEGPGLGLQTKEMINAVVDERCLTTYGRQEGLDRDPDYLRTLHFSDRWILNRVVERAIEAQAEPTEEEVRSYYEEHVDQFTLPAQIWYHQIQVASRGEAQAIRRRLLAGADFEAVAREVSQDRESAERGGRMTAFRQDGSQTLPNRFPELAETMARLKDGEISQPQRTELGWHLLRVDSRRGEYAKSYEEMREGIRDKIGNPRQMDRFAAVLDSLKQVYGVKLNQDNLDRFCFLQMDAGELLQAGRAEKDPQRRIQTYTEVLDRFPESERVPEALYLIGAEYSGMKEPERAREYLTRLVEKYPGHSLASAAQTMLAALNQGSAPAGGEGRPPEGAREAGGE